MSIHQIEADTKALSDALVHEAADEYSVAAATAAVRLLGGFFADIHRIANAAERLASPAPSASVLAFKTTET